MSSAQYLTKPKSTGIYYVGERLPDKRVKWTSTRCSRKCLSSTREMPVHGPKEVVDRLGFLFKDLAQEQLMVVMLNARNHIQAVDVITTGTINASLGHPREVYRSAVACLSASVILMHNHPSGNPEPSPDDITLTHQVRQAGEVLGIPLHDHIIVAGETYTSLAEQGEL